MEQTNSTQGSVKTGRGLAVSGFVISIIALAAWVFVSAAALLAAAIGGGMGLASFWLIFSLAGVGLCVMGFMKARNAGAKKGLAVAGMVIGLAATLLSVSTISGVSKAQAEFAKVGLGDKTIETLKAAGN